MFNPVSTYRFQFNRDFNFQQFEKIIPYLKKLGVHTVYASPIFKAGPGSTHGYDGLDPHTINPEIGTLDQLKEISKKLKTEDMGWLQDIVPNHMAFHSGNKWLMDVLEKGPQSVFASFFDEAWASDFFHGRLMVPFLGGTLEEVISRKELKITYRDRRLAFTYFENTYPLQPLSYTVLLKIKNRDVPLSIQQLFDQLPKEEDKNQYGERWEEIMGQLDSLMKNEDIRTFVETSLEEINNNPSLLKQVADEQSYRLCHWQETDKQINYRRFFTVNGLICMNIHDDHVFEIYHDLINTLTKEGIFQGLRVDHIDGLFDPQQYLDRLERITGDEGYVVVEKIIEPGENLPQHWPVQGTTGYDFLGLVNNLFTKKENEEKLSHFYEQFANDNRTIQEQLLDKKAYILFNHMAGELENLYRYFIDLNIVEKQKFASVRTESLKDAIAEFLIHCPVYRFYGNHFPLPQEEMNAVKSILDRIRKDNSDLDREVGILEEAILKKPMEGNEERNRKASLFYQRCMQFTGPLMAKGVEDTLMYSYNRFIGHNEVGDSPESFGLSADEFHHAMEERLQQWPYALNATSTHDTKRGEDVRARLNVITELADEWIGLVKQWQEMNKGLINNDEPDANDQYFIYQTIVGTFPFPGTPEDNYNNRIQEYLQKALREEKTHSDWTKPDTEYEKATGLFAQALLKKESSFRKSFESFHNKIIDYGIINSLAQVILKFTCPGIPDTYQGCELWDLSLVDPDNRRPVDYEIRKQWLDELEGKKSDCLLKELWEERFNGKIKLWLIHTLLIMRQQQPELFSTGDYIPLKAKGEYNDNLLAFARRKGSVIYLVVIPLHIASIGEGQKKKINEIDWKDTCVLLPPGTGDEWEHITSQLKDIHKKEIKVSHLFREIPFAILKGQQLVNKRSSGVLLHITSLASPFGIGDMGPEAKKFARFLHRSRQRYWQLLPLNPTEQGQGHSPYSSISGKAGNILLISPELLVKNNLLTNEDLQPFHLPHEGKTNYKEAERVKNELFEKAWNNYRNGKGSIIKQDVEAFEEKESSWLNDFALYMVLKKENNGKPWFEWDEKYKLRDQKALNELALNKAGDISKVKWLQFLFAKQWKELKNYCNGFEIQLIGDLPFYISYDSADVWANKEIFALDDKGNRNGVAGVPPDAFSDDGQLWGMPVFKWNVLKEQRYKWWVERLKKNRELFDLVRLDHFRAFASYWEVPAAEKTAKNGSWKQGPGSEFFKVMEEEFGDLPFIAEDLGDIDESVYQLRDEFHLPGMKVLQFAFSEDISQSPHIPHNYAHNFIVYTGTHDNNTIRGWFRQEGNKDHHRMEQYLGRPLKEDEVPDLLCRMAYGTVAQTAILPLQDVLGLDEIARMNKPAQIENNWEWRLMPGQITAEAENKLKEWTALFNRE